jgi:hypothetical protein
MPAPELQSGESERPIISRVPSVPTDILRMADSFADHEVDAYPLRLRIH